MCTRVHKQTCCYRPSPPLSLSRIGADFYRRGDSRGKFIKPPLLLLLPYLPWAHKQRALSRELRGGGGKVVPFPDQNCPSILSRNASPPLPFSSDREKIRIRRAGDGKIARIAFELRGNVVAFVLLKIAWMDGRMEKDTIRTNFSDP